MNLEQDGSNMRNKHNETPLDVARDKVLTNMAWDIKADYADLDETTSAFDKKVLRQQIKEYARLVDRYKHDSDGTIEALVV
jgi:hypothetical protein